MGLLQSETAAGTLQEPKRTPQATLETFAREQITFDPNGLEKSSPFPLT